MLLCMCYSCLFAGSNVPFRCFKTVFMPANVCIWISRTRTGTRTIDQGQMCHSSLGKAYTLYRKINNTNKQKHNGTYFGPLELAHFFGKMVSWGSGGIQLPDTWLWFWARLYLHKSAITVWKPLRVPVLVVVYWECVFVCVCYAFPASHCHAKMGGQLQHKHVLLYCCTCLCCSC